VMGDSVACTPQDFHPFCKEKELKNQKNIVGRGWPRS